MEPRAQTAFDLFGFVVLPGLLSADEVALLADEARAVLSSVYGDEMFTSTRTDSDEATGAPGSFLPAMGNAAPLSQYLATADDRINDISTSLLGDCVVAGSALATCLVGDTPWHNDPGIGARWVRMNAYLAPTTAVTGALRIVPGSHHDTVREALVATMDDLWDRASPDALPGVALETEPGDLIVFDPRVHHGSWGGTTRLTWSLDFVAMPPGEDPQAGSADRTSTDR